MRELGTIALLACLTSCATAEPQPGPPELALVKIVRDPFSLKFDGKTNLPIGTNVHGFVMAKLTPKFKKLMLPGGGERTIDVSEIELKRGDKTITLVKGHRAPYVEPFVQLIDPSTQATYFIGPREEFVIGSRRLRLREVNVKELNCTLEDTKSGEQFIIRRMAQPEN